MVTKTAIDRPTKREIERAIEIINSLAVFAANHGCFMEPNSDLIKLTTWLQILIETEGPTNG